MNMPMDTKGDRIYVANTGEDSISVIDENTLEPVDKIFLYDDDKKSAVSPATCCMPVFGPHSIKADVKTKRLYTANCYDNSVSIIDTKENRILDRVLAGSFPHSIAIDNVGNHVYITNQDSDSLCVLRGDNFKVVAYIPVGCMPQGVCISPDNKLIAVANVYSNDITILSTGKVEVSGRISAPYNPSQLIFSRDGSTLYSTGVDDENSKKGVIMVIDMNKARVVKRIPVGQVPIQLCLHPNKNILYVTNTGSGDICVMDTHKDKIIDRIRVNGMVHGIVINKQATRLFVSNIQHDRIIALSTADYTVQRSIGVGKEPHSLCIL